MPFTKQNNIDFNIKDDQIILSKRYLDSSKKYFKKITGTRFGSILNLNKYASPFKTWTIMVNIFKDVMDPTLAKVGNTIEPKIRDYVQQKINCKYLFYNPSEIGWDVFKDNEIFGGIPDGEPVNENSQVDYSKYPMLEIKTSSIDSFVYERKNNALYMKKDFKGFPVVKQKNQKMDSWFNVNKQIEIPVEYQYQLGLYMYLRNTTKGMFAVAFLKPENYVYPEKYVIDPELVYIVDASMINREEVSKAIEKATEWYNKYIKTGISPKMTMNDKLWLRSELGNF